MAMSGKRKKEWKSPELKTLAVDLTSVAGSMFAPGDGNSGSGRSPVPPTS